MQQSAFEESRLPEHHNYKRFAEPLKQSAPTRKDQKMSVRKIANRLNISPSTVSLALRGDTKISRFTRNKVEKEAERIGYRRDAKLNEMMAHLRNRGLRPTESCIGVLSFTKDLRPWEQSVQGKATYQAMTDYAERLGYRLEPFRLKEEGMSLGRLLKILDTRRIEGLFCFGEQGAEIPFPEELLGCSVVSVGLGFEERLNCVARDSFGDMLAALDKLASQGCSRVGLSLGESLTDLEAQRYLGAYFCMANHRSESLVYNGASKRRDTMVDWLYEAKPDAVICAGVSDLAADSKLSQVCRAENVRLLDMDLTTRDGLGLRLNARKLGERAVDMLVQCMISRESGLPQCPKLELVRSDWVDTRKNHRDLKKVRFDASFASSEQIVAAS